MNGMLKFCSDFDFDTIILTLPGFKILRGNLLKTFSSPQIATPTDKPLVAARLPSFQKLEERECYSSLFLYSKICLIKL